MHIKNFLENLGESCPELDGGGTFKRFANQVPLSTVSTAVSMALRLMHDCGQIQLDRVADAEELKLATDEAHDVQIVSHVGFSSG